MRRWLLWIFGGILLGGIVHLATVLAMPAAATRDAYSRLTALTSVNAMAMLPAATPRASIMPFMDPAFAEAACRYDLAHGPIKLTAPVGQSYMSVTFYTRESVAYYAINGRAAGGRVIALDLMTKRQQAQMPEEQGVTAADRLIVDSPTTTGLILVRALADQPGLMPMARRTLAAARCHPEPAHQ